MLLEIDDLMAHSTPDVNKEDLGRVRRGNQFLDRVDLEPGSIDAALGTNGHHDIEGLLYPRIRGDPVEVVEFGTCGILERTVEGVCRRRIALLSKIIW